MTLNLLQKSALGLSGLTSIGIGVFILAALGLEVLIAAICVFAFAPAGRASRCHVQSN